MANTIKIFELKTLGYDKLIKELDTLEKKFLKLKIAKADLEVIGSKLTSTQIISLEENEKALAKVNRELQKNKLLRLEAEQSVRAALAFKQKELASLKAEAGSIADLTLKMKQLVAARKLLNESGSGTVTVGGKSLNYAQLTAEIKTYQTELDRLNAKEAKHTTIVKAEAGGIADLTAKYKELTTAIKQSSPTSTKPILFGGQSLNYTEAIAKAKELQAQIASLNAQFARTGPIAQQALTGIAAGFNSLKTQFSQFVLTYIGAFAAFRTASLLLKENVEISDSLANLQIRMKGTKEDVDNLVDSLRKINTRTSLQGLIELAEIISKKGVRKEDLADLTAEFDKLNVVLGTEIGEPNTATANIIKIITIFNDDKNITAERVREIGTSLFKLTTTGVATGEFLINFAERVGAVRGITGLTTTEIFGMGAALQQLGQRVELSGTAIIQLTTKMFSNVEKWADAAGLSAEAFRKILDASPAEALISIGENLKNLPAEEIAARFEEVVVAFNEVGITGARIKAVFGDIATNADFVRDRIAKAKVGLADYATQTAALELKQNTFAATLQRIRKEFELIGTSRAVQVALAAVASLLLVVVSNLGLLVSALLVYGGALAIVNAQLIYQRINIIAWTIAMNIQHAAWILGNTLAKAYAATLALVSRGFIALGLSARAASIAAGPFVIALTALVGLGLLLRDAFNSARRSLEFYTNEQRIELEINKKVNESISTQVNELNILVEAIKSEITTLDTKKVLLEKLIEKNALFSEALRDNVINVTALNAILLTAISILEKFGRAQVSESLAGEKFADFQEVFDLRQKIEIEAGVKKPKSLISFIQNLGLTRGERNLVLKYLQIADLAGSNVNLILESLKKEEIRRYEIYQAYKKIAVRNLDELEQDKKLTTKQEERIKALSLKEKITKAELEKLNEDELDFIIKAITEQRTKLKEGDPLIKDYNDKLEKFQARLDAIRNKKTPAGRPYRGARIDGEDKDALSLIEAARRLALAQRESEFSVLQLTNELTFKEEVKFTEDIRNINTKFLDQKIEYLNKQKNLNDKEKEILAGFIKERADIILRSQKDIQSIFDKQFTLEKNNLKAALDNNIANLRLQIAESEADPITSFREKAQFKLDTDTKILDLQKKFNEDIDKLEKEYIQKSKENSKQGADEQLNILKQLLEDQKNLREADIKDINLLGEKIKLQWNVVFEKIRQTILSNDKVTAQKRARQLEQLAKQETYNLALAEYKTALQAYDKIKKLWDQQLIAEKEFLTAKARLNKAFTDLQEAGRGIKTSGLIRTPSTSNSLASAASGLNDLFGFDEGSAEATFLAFALTEAWETATQVMSQYFERERQAIQDNLDLQLERLDIEKEQVRSRATTQAELDSIDKQYAAKAKKARQEAGEQLKKSKRAEAKIAFATELANIWSTVWQLGPIAGAIFGVVLSALAAVRYGSTVKSINAEKFAKGGFISEGGQIEGKSHAQGGVPFNYEAEGGELAIIRTRDSNKNRIHSITGNFEQIASALNTLGGGKTFKSGAKVFAEGGFLGSNYTAPVFRPSSINSSSDLDSLRDNMIQLALEQSRRIDRLQVVQVTGTVSEALHKQVKQSAIGSLI